MTPSTSASSSSAQAHKPALALEEALRLLSELTAGCTDANGSASCSHAAVKSSSAYTRAALRAVLSAADAAELCARETGDEQLLARAASARTQVATARIVIRRQAAASEERELMQGATSRDKRQETHAEMVARDIKKELRNVTAVVAEEIARTDATSTIVDSSSEALRKTREKQRSWFGRLAEGADTLAELRNAERRANAVLALSVILFFVVAVMILRKQVVNSKVNAFIIRPAVKIARAPFRVALGSIRLAARVRTKWIADTKNGRRRRAAAKAKMARIKTRIKANASAYVQDLRRKVRAHAKVDAENQHEDVSEGMRKGEVHGEAAENHQEENPISKGREQVADRVRDVSSEKKAEL